MLTLREVAERTGVSPATLRRWVSSAVIPAMTGKRGERWTPQAADARVVARSEHLTFDGVGQVKMKGFDQPVELCRATMPS